MAKKCFSCDYPYVPSGGICPNCGKDNSVSYSDVSWLIKIFGIIFGVIMIFYFYKEFTFEEEDLYNNEYILDGNYRISFNRFEYDIFQMNSDGLMDSHDYGGKGNWKIKDGKLILDSNDSNCPETRNKKGVYSKEDLKDFHK
jgi:hypothetical protein